MKDEIKVRNLAQQAIDVLNDLKDLKPGEEYEAGMPVDIMANTLLDYITNLQEENERLNLELSGYRQAILNDDNLMGLKSRIDKAIKYINAGKTFDDIDVGKVVNKIQNDLLNILQGKSDE